jgi:hypothetical protein
VHQPVHQPGQTDAEMGWRLWLRAVAIGLGLAFGAVALYVLSLTVVGLVFPFLTSEGFKPTEQVGYGQLYAAFVAIAIAGTFGSFAVKQLELGRQAIALEIAARVDSQHAESKRILRALYLELWSNRIAALHYEGRVQQARGHRFEEPVFHSKTYESAIGGPLWAIPAAERVWPDLSEASSAFGSYRESLSLGVGNVCFLWVPSSRCSGETGAGVQSRPGSYRRSPGSSGPGR